MAEIVYSKVGEIKCKAKSLRYTGSFMGVSQLSVDIVSPVPVNLEIGDYIVFSYDGIRYTIVDLPQVQKQSSSGSTGDAFIYNDIVFKSPIGLLAHIDYLDTVLNENNVHYSTLPVFTFYGTVKDFADRLQANINRIYPSGWKVSVEGYNDTSNANYDILHEYNEISISNIKCLDSLSIPYDTWGVTYVFMVDDEGNNCIVFNHSLDSTSAKKYGKGNGLYSLTKRMSTEKAIITRLRAYGGTDNLPARYYNNLDGIDEGIYLPNLMIPRSKWKNQNDPITAYIDSTDIDVNDTAMSKYGIREESVFFDGSGDNKNIKPTIKGITAGMIRAAKAEAGDTDNVPLESDYPDDERMDKILSCDVPDDNGLTREGEKLYSTTIDFNVIKGEDIIQPTYSTTANESDTFRKFSFSADVETNLVINTPAIYRINDSNNNIGNNPIISIADSKFGSITWNGSVRSGYMDYAKMDVITIDNDGRETVCAEGIELSWEVNTHVVDGQNRTLLDIFFAGGAANDVPAYFSIQNKGTVKFRIQISGACYFSTGAFAKLRAQRYSIPMIASMGALIQSKIFRIYIKQIGFNIEDYASTEEAKLVINSGACAGRSFNIKKNSVAEYFRYNSPGQIHTQIGWVFECFRSLDESIDQYFPNNIFPIKEGDEFVLTGLEMPDLYVRVAGQRLYDEAVELLRKRKDGLEVYELDIDNKVAYLDKVTIKEGMLIPLYDSDLKIGTKTDDSINYDYRIIDSVTIEIGEEPIPIIKAVLREEKEESVFKTLNRKLNTVASRTTQNVIRTQIVRVAEEVVRSNAPAYSSSAPEQGLSDFVTLSTEQTITGKKTFAEDAVFGADGSRLFIPSGDTPGTYDIFVDPGMAVEGEEPTGGSGSGSGEWEKWEDAAGTDVPVGFHRVTSTFPTSFIKGHIYFFTDTGQLALATGTSSASLSYYSSLVRNVSYNTVSKTMTIIPAGEHRSPVTIDLSSFAEKAQLGDLSDLTTTAKSDLVSAINEVLAAVKAGGSGSKVTVDREAFPPQEGGGILVAYTIKQGGKTVGVINIPKDMVVSSGTVETNPYGQPSGTYLVLTLANATSDKVYINVGSLVDIYTAAKNAAQVQLSINSATREISATIVAGSITTTELASKCVTGAKLADGAVSTSHISNGAVSILKLESSLQKILNNALSASDITTGKTNGSIAVEGKDVPVKGLGSAAYKDEGYFVTVGTAQTITGKKTFAEDAVFGAGGSRLFIPSGDTPGTYDIFVDPGMAVEGEEPTGGSGSGTWETWEDAAGTDVPVGFHLLTSLAGQIFNKGHIYFNEETGILYVALSSGSNVSSLKPFAGRVDSVSYNASTKTLTVKNTSGSSNTYDLSGLSGQPLWCGRVSAFGVATKNSGTLTITVNRSNEGVYGVKGAPAGRTIVVSPLDYVLGSVSLVKAPHIAVVSQSSTGTLTVRMYTLDGTLDDFGFSLMIM